MSSASAANNPAPRWRTLLPRLSSHWSQPSPSQRRAASSSLSIVTSRLCYDNSRSWCRLCNSWPEPRSRRPQRPQQRRTRRQVSWCCHEGQWVPPGAALRASWCPPVGAASRAGWCCSEVGHPAQGVGQRIVSTSRCSRPLTENVTLHCAKSYIGPKWVKRE